ncbi:MAG: hypothetical protein ACQERJ_09250 [Bacillota bacterium]
MQKKILMMLSLLTLVVLVSGCLVQDDSKTMMGSEEKSEVKEKAREITNDFFEYNSYDSTTDNNYSAQNLIELFSSDAAGIKILSMSGSPTEKSLDELKEELYEKETLFEAFEAQLDNDKFEYNSYKLTFDYETIFVDNEIEEYTAHYRVQFQVFEEINGEKISTPAGVPDGITDNGVITIDLVNENAGWKIDKMEINFQEIGAISL